MKIEIKHRFTGTVLFTAEAASITVAVRKALESGADLRGANLSDADLRDADLRDADLRLADLRDADLRDADLRLADLRDADLRDADLRDADLRDANLIGADLRGADGLDGVKGDLFTVLLATPTEVAGLRQALVEGRVNGSQYEGECACLVGTLANVKGCDYESIPRVRPDSSRPSERWFVAIRPGHTPDNDPIVKLTVEMIDEFSELFAAAMNAVHSQREVEESQ